MKTHLQLLCLIMVLLGFVFCHAYALETSEPKNWMPLVSAARNLSPNAVAEMEQKLAKNPDDLTIAYQVIGYYFFADYKDTAAKAKFRTYVFQMIERHPDADILGYYAGKFYRGLVDEAELQKNWDNAIARYPGNLKIMINAAESLTQVNIDLGITYWLQICRMAPDNLTVHRSLAYVYQRKANWNSRNGDPLEFYEKAYDEFVFASSLADERQKRSLLISLGKAALDAREFEAAATYAEEMLTLGKPVAKYKGNGDLLYCAYQIKGRLALENGDFTAAEKFIMQSLDLPDNFTWNNNGPNMSLANEFLLHGGNPEVIIAFLGKCGKYWKDQKKIEQWVEALKAGNAPNFGSNIYF